MGDRVLVRQEVTGDHDGVRMEGAQRLHPFDLAALAGNQVQIRQMQDPKTRLTDGQDGRGHPAQGVLLGLPARVGQGGRTEGDGAQGCAGEGCHPSIVPRGTPAAHRCACRPRSPCRGSHGLAGATMTP